MSPARFICIGTHHKTGTIWMRKVWWQIKEEQGIPMMQCYRAKRLADLPDTGPQIIVNWDSTFPRELLAMPEARFIHMIRDPRDVLLSGMRYHRIAPLGNEKFLRKARAEWRGMTYQGYLNTLADDRARLLFEMENKHDDTLQEMVMWNYHHPNAVELRYEDLIQDHDCAMFRGILERFAIEGLDIDRAVQSYWENSLFGGLAQNGPQDDRQAKHISSGGQAQWKTALPRDIARIYAKRYGSALKMLGYAENDDWVETCPVNPEHDAAPARSHKELVNKD